LKHIDENGRLWGYWQYNYAQREPTFFIDREIIFLEKNPSSYDFYGISPVQTVLNILDAMITSVDQTMNFYKRGAIPQGLLAAEMSEDEYQAFVAYWKNEIQGKPYKFPIVRHANVEFIPFNPSQKDIFFLDGLDWFARVVMSAFHVTPHELGVTDAVNKATAQQQSLVFKRKSIKPLLDLIQDAINREIIPEFDDQDRIVFEFVYEPDIEEQTMIQQIDQSKFTTGQLSINEWRAQQGLEPVPWGDVPALLLQQGIYSLEQLEQKKNPQNPFTDLDLSSLSEMLRENDNEESSDEQESEDEEQEDEEDGEDTSKDLLGDFEKKRLSDEELDAYEKRAQELKKRAEKFEKQLEKEIKLYFATILTHITKIDPSVFNGYDAEQVAEHFANLFDEEVLIDIIQKYVVASYQLGLKTVDEELDIEPLEKGLAENLRYISRFGAIIAKTMLTKIKETIKFQVHERVSKGFSFKNVITFLRTNLLKSMRNSAELTAQTTVYTSFNIARINKLQDYGYVGWYFYTMQDERVCKICKKHHGKFYKFTDLRYRPPLHPRCRCIVKPTQTKPLPEYLSTTKSGFTRPKPSEMSYSAAIGQIELMFNKSIAEFFEDLNNTSSREIAEKTGLSHTTIQKIVKIVKT